MNIPDIRRKKRTTPRVPGAPMTAHEKRAEHKRLARAAALHFATSWTKNPNAPDNVRAAAVAALNSKKPELAAQELLRLTVRAVYPWHSWPLSWMMARSTPTTTGSGKTRKY